METRIDGQVLGVGEDQSPVVDRDRPPMHRRSLVPTTTGVGHCRIVLDDLPDDVGRGAPADQHPDTDRQHRAIDRPVAAVSDRAAPPFRSANTPGSSISTARTRHVSGPTRTPPTHAALRGRPFSTLPPHRRGAAMPLAGTTPGPGRCPAPASPPRRHRGSRTRTGARWSRSGHRPYSSRCCADRGRRVVRMVNLSVCGSMYRSCWQAERTNPDGRAIR